jgi:hypothetical protein
MGLPGSKEANDEAQCHMDTHSRARRAWHALYCTCSMGTMVVGNHSLYN